MGLFDSIFGATTQKTKSTSTVQLPEWLTSASQQVAGQVGQIGNQNFTPYGGDRVADLTPDQTAAFDYVRNLQGGANQGAADILGAAGTAAPQITNPYAPSQYSSDYTPGQYTPASTQAPQYDASGNPLATMNPYASGETGPAQFTSGYTAPQYGGPTRLIDNIPGAAGGPEGSIQDYMNPYYDQVIAQALADIERTGMIQRQGVDAKANMAGAFGDSGHGLEQAELTRNLLGQAARTSVEGRASAYDDAMRRREADLGRGIDLYKTDAQLQEAGANRALETFRTNVQSNSDYQNRMLQAFQTNANLSQAQASQALEAFRTNAGLTADWENRLLETFKTNMGLQENQANRLLDTFKVNAGLQEAQADRNLQTQKANADLVMQQIQNRMNAPGMAQGLQTQFAELLAKSGATQQAQGQAEANAQYEEFLRQIGFDTQQAKDMAAILSQLPKDVTTTGVSKTPGASPFAQVLGAVAPIAGAIIGGPAGAAAGAASAAGAQGIVPSGFYGAGTPGYGQLY